MAGFKRVFVAFPGFNILGNIESVNTIDIPPPASPLGAGVGVVCVVGEFERGPIESPIRVFGGSDLEATFGGLGFTKDGQALQLPVAARSAESTQVWEGNGFVNLRNKRFSGLIICRVDNSAGEVVFNRLACLVGDAAPFDLEPGDDLQVSVDGGAPTVVTFTATAASLLASGAIYPTGFIGGETLEVALDGGPTVVVTFQAADQTLAQVIGRINGRLASTVSFDTGGQLELRSNVRGFSGTVEVVGGTAVTALGLPFPPVPQVDTWTVVSNAVPGLYTMRTTMVINGVTVDFDASYTSIAPDTVTVVRDALLLALIALGVPKITFVSSGVDAIVATGNVNFPFTSTVFAEPAGGQLTIALTTPGVFSFSTGTGNVANVDLVIQAEAEAVIGAVPGVVVDVDGEGRLRLCATTTPATGTLEVSGGTAAPGLGITTGLLADAASSVASVIPAGTRLRDTTTQALWVTLEDAEVEADDGGPYSIRVRPGLDDDTTPTALAGDLTEVVDVLADGFAVTNALDVARLGAAQMDVRYLDAINATIDVSGVPHDINIMYAARNTERIMGFLRSNAVDATASGHRARKAMMGPPVGTSRTDARAASGVGVGNVGREQRVFYCFPGLTTFVPEIAQIGLAGGVGFSEDGVVEVRSDGFYASVGSVLPPEENRGQQLSDTNYGPLLALSLEDAYNKELGGVGLTIDDYIQFKADGIIAPRVDRVAGIVFQSDVTSVNPQTQPALVDAKRRFFGDFIIDSLSDIAVGYVKKLNTPARRRALLSTINGFLEQLASPNQPETSRLEDFRVVDETTPEQRAQGFQIMSVGVRTFASMDFIVFRTTVGTTVNVEEIGA